MCCRIFYSVLDKYIYKLKSLLHLTLQYCRKYHVKLSANKTKLQVYLPPGFSAADEDFLKITSIIEIEGKRIDFVDTTEHVAS